jgi:hypothetical protein
MFSQILVKSLLLCVESKKNHFPKQYLVYFVNASVRMNQMH